MAYDSSIRLKQLNQSELSGFVSGILALFPFQNISGNLIPSGSGVYNIGSSLYPYAQIFANELSLASGSGINFGNTSFNAYTSGSGAYIDVGGYVFSFNGDYVFIQGPSGLQGLSGVQGPTGATGISVTGITYNTTSHILSFYLSNNTSTGFNFQGLSGATGTSVTGFFQSGNYILPQFSNYQGLGAPISLIAGPQGMPGGVTLNFQQSGTSYTSGANPPDSGFPSQVIINPYFSGNSFPDITLMRGMSYTLNSSGLNTHTLTSGDITIMSGFFSGQSLPFQAGNKINYYEDAYNTGYWRPVFFPSGTATGFYNSNTTPSLFVETTNSVVYYNLVNNPYRTQISFTTSFAAQSQYQYGFVLYTLGQDTTTDSMILSSSTSTGFAVVVGNAIFSSQAGPAGIQGPIGPSGNIGPTGNIGPVGATGENGADVVGYTYSGVGNNIYIQFQLANGITQPWIPLPAGGPSGASGAVGTLSNNFQGNFASGTTYYNDNIVFSSGSSFINTGTTISGIYPPNVPWQMLCQSGTIGATGPVGPTGATGAAGSISNHFSGTYSGLPNVYIPNSIVVQSGSSYINTGVSNISGIAPPSVPWQILASGGATGPQGAAGVPTTLRPENFFSLVYGNGIGSASS